METRLKILGHPVHPMLIVFPLGLLTMALVFDVLYLLTQNVVFATVAFYDITTGIIGGLAAAVFGFLDWLTIRGGTRAKRIGLLHGLGNVSAVLLFSVSWYLRAPASAYIPTNAAFVLGLIAVGFAALSGWLGGELVDRMGVGIDPGANLDAPNSLSGKPADVTHPTHP